MANPKPNSAAVQAENIEPSFVRKTVTDLKEVYKLSRPETDEEVKDRIYSYFEFCERTGMRPGIELLCLFLGVSRTSLWNWSQGIKCSPQRMDMINHAKALIAAFLEQSHLQGKLNPVSAIFLSKTWLNYSDDVTVRIDAPQRNEIPTETLEQIALKRRLNPVSMPEKPEID